MRGLKRGQSLKVLNGVTERAAVFTERSQQQQQERRVGKTVILNTVIKHLMDYSRGNVKELKPSVLTSKAEDR